MKKSIYEVKLEIDTQEGVATIGHKELPVLKESEQAIAIDDDLFTTIYKKSITDSATRLDAVKQEKNYLNDDKKLFIGYFRSLPDGKRQVSEFAKAYLRSKVAKYDKVIKALETEV